MLISIDIPVRDDNDVLIGGSPFSQMQQQRAEQFLLYRSIERKCLSVLQRCKTRKTLLQIHAHMLRNSIETNVHIFTKFIITCASVALSGSSAESLATIRHARRLFDYRGHKGDTFLCNAMIKAHTDARQYSESFTLYKYLRRNTGFVPDSFTFTSLAKACGMCMGLSDGLEIHCHVLKTGFCLDLYVSTAFVHMYSKWGELGFARKLFDEMTERSLVSWTALMGGYLKSGDMHSARLLFEQMPEKDTAACNAMLDGYVKVGDMYSARKLFNGMPDRNIISWTTMIYGYCYSGDVSSARSLFDAMPDRNLHSWNAMIGGYCQNKQHSKALELFHEMQHSSLFEPDKVTVVSILPAIADLGALDLGSWVHRFVQRKKLDQAVNVCTALIDMYAKCGEISLARRVFSELPQKKNTAPWNALINGFALNGCAYEALEAFMDMQHEGAKPNDITMIGVLSACNHGGLLEEGKKWFKAMEKFGLTPKIEHYGCVIDLLGRAGRMEEAETLIKIMPYETNEIILSSFLFACGSSKDFSRAQGILNLVINKDPNNEGNYITLRNLYAVENRWKDAAEIEGLVWRNGAKKEVGYSSIEVDSRVSEFISGGGNHPQRETIDSVLGQLWMHTSENVVTHPCTVV